MNFLFRTDASHQIGTGHVMRCLTLANALRDRGARCRFVCRTHEGNLLERIQQEGYETIALPLDCSPNLERDADQPTLAHADWLGTDWLMDAQQTIAALGDNPPDWLIVDHYALDMRWESVLRPYCGKIMVIDDLADRKHDCNLLLDQNLVVDLTNRYNDLVPDYCFRLLGPEFALLQPRYSELHTRTQPRLGPVQRIFVFFGGADNYNLTSRAISAFLALKRPDLIMDVVINTLSTYAASIRDQVKTHVNITLHETLPDLASLIQKADLAIGACGATSWERCCLGLPSLVITLAENQKPIATELDRQGFVRWLGHYDTVTESALKNALLDAIQDEGIADWSRRCMKLVDGQGVIRVILYKLELSI